MKNIAEVKQEERGRRIGEIVKILKNKKGDFDREEFILEICIKYCVQQRKASEYLRVAEYMLKSKK